MFSDKGHVFLSYSDIWIDQTQDQQIELIEIIFYFEQTSINSKWNFRITNIIFSTEDNQEAKINKIFMQL